MTKSGLKPAKGRRAAFLALGSLVLAGAGTYFYASRVATRRYRLEHLRVKTGPRNLSHAAPVDRDGPVSGGDEAIRLRILHLSDLHLCHPESHKLEFLKRVTDDDYDMVVVTGDIFEDFSGLQYARSILSRPPRLGAYAVLGNHDYYDYTMFHKVVGRMWRKYRHPEELRNVRPIVDALRRAGISVLRNESVTLDKNRLHLVGIDYPGIDDQELGRLVKGAPDDYMVLVLRHVPRGLDQIAELGAHLAFVGHTHGGQVRLPGFGAVITDCELPRRDACGLIRRGNTFVHVSRGVGADPRSNLRLFCPPHATVLEVEH